VHKINVYALRRILYGVYLMIIVHVKVLPVFIIVTHLSISLYTIEAYYHLDDLPSKALPVTSNE